ncbi:putative phosphatidylinositol-3,4,5-trisphosphate 3-phosphatase [Aspergillus ibericus CBS 121593]|uniref:phosphatidylinositol-3,4,5-trisphosphate 3-phosphatase n=1 Tax=Aspergillus ibericus CBS 121593 TaxID=1448316 RepID=A0A395GNW2_9EURO|nr:phosphatases II [Aspergillus ibericus CBS 121593]RAK97191.1 phosphatases II [Aspergillus ibericus CBS 121593]
MASILRQIVAGPRLQHPEAGLDLCYVTDNIIATSGPSSNYPQRAYRNPLDELVKFLDYKHGSDWCIWEFRAEGTGYPDSEVYNRIHHYPWPDHHPPPFALIPAMTGSMRNWIHRLDEPESKEKKKARVAVVHCKAGKGRSGTVACSYLISQEGWKADDALQRFTERRMRVGFGAGVSIPSQVRWVGYVDRWTNQMGKKYIERPVEILEVHVWGLRDGVKVAVEGFVDQGKRIKKYHLFHRSERTVIDEGKSKTMSPEAADEHANGNDSHKEPPPSAAALPSETDSPLSAIDSPVTADSPPKHVSAVIFRPNQPISVPTSDINIDFERRSKAAYTGWAMVTSIAHVWFNTYFEGGDQHDSGVFEAEWDALDGIKGTTRKGVKALDRVKVVWRYANQPGTSHPDTGKPISEPQPGEPIPETQPPDWHIHGSDSPSDQENLPAQEVNADSDPEPKNSTEHPHSHSSKHNSTHHPILSELSTAAASAMEGLNKQLGLRKQTDESKDVSLAGSSEDESGSNSKSKTKKVWSSVDEDK